MNTHSTESASEVRRDQFRTVRGMEFPWTSRTTYLANASVGPIPARTRSALDRFQDARDEPYRLSDRRLMGILELARATAARLVNAEVEEIGLATNTSYGLNAAAAALPFAPGDIILVPDGEFPANVYPWLMLAQRGVKVELIPATAQGWPDEARIVDRVTDPAVRGLAISLVQFANGYRCDLNLLSDVCRANGVFLVVDAIQGLGAVPLDVRETPVDLLSCGAQKWLLSPWGSGFFYVRRELIEQLTPGFAGWMAFAGTDDFSRLTAYDCTFHPDARRFEMITLPYQDLVGMVESVGLLLELEIDRILQHVRELREPIESRSHAGAFQVVSPTDPTHDSAITCVQTSDAAASYRALREADVVCSFREGNIRLAPHFFNTVDEMDRVAEILAGR
jgi:cysteine desulfurase/selenocysteine lyase